jgi:prepilin-type processing-associated H-X9-DG protein
MAKWVNEHSDYVYASAGLTNEAPYDRVLIHESSSAHDHEGMNMLYGDGHVEFQPLYEAQRQIESAGKTDTNLPKDGGL